MPPPRICIMRSCIRSFAAAISSLLTAPSPSASRRSKRRVGSGGASSSSALSLPSPLLSYCRRSPSRSVEPATEKLISPPSLAMPSPLASRTRMPSPRPAHEVASRTPSPSWSKAAPADDDTKSSPSPPRSSVTGVTRVPISVFKLVIVTPCSSTRMSLAGFGLVPTC